MLESEVFNDDELMLINDDAPVPTSKPAVVGFSDDELGLLDDITSKDQTDPTLQALDAASKHDPDQSAVTIQLAKERDLPQPVVTDNLAEIQRRQRLDEVDIYRLDSRLKDKLNDPDFAKVAHDDLDTLSEIGDLVGNIGSATWSGTHMLASGGYGMLEGATDIVDFFTLHQLQQRGVIDYDPLKDVSNFFRGARWATKTSAEGYTPETDSEVMKAVYSGFQSVGMNAVPMGLGIKSARTAYALGGMVSATMGMSYGDARDQGMQVGSAAAFAAVDGVVEYMTEQNPAVNLIEGFGLNQPFVKKFIYQQLSEGVGEQVATAMQDFNAWAFLPENADKTFDDYITERPDAAFQTFISTFVATSTTTGVVHGAEYVTRDRSKPDTLDSENELALRNAIAVEANKEAQGRLDKIIELSQSSLTNERASDQFKEYVASIDPDANVFIDASAVRELDPELIPDFMQEQLDNLDGDVIIPMDVFMSDVATDDVMVESLRNHMRLYETGMTLDDIETDNGASLDRLVERADATRELKTEAEAVFETVKDQLVGTRKMSSADARAAAALYPAFAAVKAAEHGISVTQAFQDMNFKIIGADVDIEDAANATVDKVILDQAKVEGYEGGNRGEAQEWVDASAKGIDMSAAAREKRGVDFGGEENFYHGSTHGITEFDGSMGNIDGDWGAGTYATNSKDDLGENYTDLNAPDLTNKINKRVDELNDAFYDDEFVRDELLEEHGYTLEQYETDPEAVTADIAGKEIRGDNEGVSYELKINRDNYATIGGVDETVIDGDPDMLFDDIETAFHDTGLFINDVETINVIMSEFADEIMDGSVTATDIDRAIREESPELYDYDTGEMINAGAVSAMVLENLGFEGVIDNTVNKKFGAGRRFGTSMEGVDSGTQHVITFAGNEHNVRSINAAFDPDRVTSKNTLDQAPLLTAQPHSDKTQRANTKGSYAKVASMIDPAAGAILDYGAGMGIGTDLLRAEFGDQVVAYEPLPSNWKSSTPVNFTDAAGTGGDYGTIVSLGVLEVLGKTRRKSVLLDILDKLSVGGTAIISTSKGMTSYVKELAGADYTVTTSKGMIKVVRNIPQVSSEQNFGNVDLIETVEITETGSQVEIRQNAQMEFNRLVKRRKSVELLRDCLNA